MNSPYVSIVIAAYKSNHDHILAAIDSALAQESSSLEILIRDDSPTDSLRKVVSSRKDLRVHYVHNTPSLGVANNHWHAFRQARGEFITILNHDDLIQPGFIGALASELENHPESVLAFCDHWIIDNDGQVQLDKTNQASLTYGRSTLSPGLHQPFDNLLIAQTIPMAMGAMFRSSALPEVLPEHAGPAYDFWLTYLLSRAGGGACYVPQRLSSWRSHLGNLTSGGGLEWLIGSSICWEAIANDKNLSIHKTLARCNAADGFTACAVRAWRNSMPLLCVKFAVRSLKNKFSIRGFALLFLLPWVPAASVNLFHRKLPS